jgi:hypothetical protein
MVRVLRLFRISKRRILLTGGIFLFVLMYVPLIKCLDDVKTGTSTCKEMKICTTDYYNSIGKVLLTYGTPVCPKNQLTPLGLALLIVLCMVASYLVACGIDLLYTKYRDL